eukprot:Lithocolla_globosa_v1_NODE_1121_length_2853_cov_5.404217.p4 type:complete len:104 gc:universal NODE_1121_length_2853_cov_5.404217:1964-2275(+)
MDSCSVLPLMCVRMKLTRSSTSPTLQTAKMAPLVSWSSPSSMSFWTCVWESNKYSVRPRENTMKDFSEREVRINPHIDEDSISVKVLLNKATSDELTPGGRRV